MISINEIHEFLASGELSNLYMADGGLGTGELKPEYKEVVNKSIYLGLTNLFTRFVLKRKFIQHSYILQGNGLRTFWGVGIGEQGFSVSEPDFIQFLKIKVNGKEYDVNRDYVLVDTNSFKFINPVTHNDTIEVEYQANHKPIDKYDTYIELPRAYLNALCYFVASRLYTSIVNQLDGDLNESTRYAQKYLQEIQMLENKGIDVDDFNQMGLFDERGFV